jgi:hypothetical protein
MCDGRNIVQTHTIGYLRKRFVSLFKQNMRQRVDSTMQMIFFVSILLFSPIVATAGFLCAGFFDMTMVDPVGLWIGAVLFSSVIYLYLLHQDTIAVRESTADVFVTYPKMRRVLMASARTVWEDEENTEQPSRLRQKPMLRVVGK